MVSITDPVTLVSLSIVVTSVLIAMKIILDLASPTVRSRYSRAVEYIFVVGIVLGIVFPWIEQVGLIAAATTAVLLLVSSVYYNILRGSVTLFSLLHVPWRPREVVKEWFVYFAVATGVIGIVSTTVSIGIPFFLPVSFGFFIPLSFDALAVLATLLDFTIYIPPYEIVNSIIFRFTSEKYDMTKGETFDLEDIDFRSIVKATVYTPLDVRDSLEQLAREGMATKYSPTLLGRVRYRINPYGIRFLETSSKELSIRISSEKKDLEERIRYLQQRTAKPEELEARVLRRALVELGVLTKNIQRMRQRYGPLLEETWENQMNKRIGEVTQIVQASSTKSKT